MKKVYKPPKVEEENEKDKTYTLMTIKNGMGQCKNTYL